MSVFQRLRWFLAASCPYAVILLLYGIFCAATAISYPSTRFNPVNTESGTIVFADAPGVYKGKVSYLGLPLSFLTWREEAISPQRDAPMKTVAVRFSVLAAALDAALLACFFVVVAVTAPSDRNGFKRARECVLLIAILMIFAIMALWFSPLHVGSIDPYDTSVSPLREVR